MPAPLALTEAQSNELVEAYIAEQTLVFQEYEAAGKEALPYTNGDWMELIYDGSMPELSERMASARSYAQRIRDRAAGVLSREQLVVFEQMQGEVLAQLERYQRNTSYRKYEGQPTITNAPTPVAATTTDLAPAFRWTPKEFLQKYNDPAGRKELLAAALVNARRLLEGFDKKRNLDPATFEKLVQLTAGQELERRALQFRCTAVDRACDARAEYRALLDRNRIDVQALLGPRGYEESQDWIHSHDERRVVSNLARRMPENLALSDKQSAELVSALDDEQVQVYGDTARNHQSPVPFINADGMEVLYDSRATSVEERMESARSYSQRMRHKVASVLNGEQFSIFNQLQDKVLVDLQRYLGSDAAKRTAAAVNSVAADEPTSPPPGSGEWTRELARYYGDDGEGRKQLRAEELSFVRQWLNGFDDFYKLDAVRLEKLIQLTADQAAEYKTMHSRCNDVVNPGCDLEKYSQEMRARHAQATNASIGAGTYEASQLWMFSGDERRMVKSLGGRLPENLQLTDDQSYALVKALYDGRFAYYSSDVHYPYPFRSPNGMMVLYPYMLPTTEERVAAARSYAQLLRDGAAKVLNAGQQSILNQMIDEALSDLQGSLRTQEVAQRSGS
jgi:hypothetical protein